MKNFITNISPRTAARVTGLGIIILVIIAPFAILFILESLIIVPEDAAATVKNIKANEFLFGLAICIYFIVLFIDFVIAIALYIVLKQVNKNLALFGAVLRLVYITIMVISLLALVLLFVETYNNSVLIAYIFFIGHLFVLGYVVFKSDYIPRILGILLMIGSLCYIIIEYGHFFISMEWYNLLYMIALVPASISEISLGLWLLLKNAKIPERLNNEESV